MLSTNKLFLLSSVEQSPENYSKIIRYIIWKSKPTNLLINMQYISLFNNSTNKENEFGDENEKILSDFEFCTKSILMISEVFI